MVRKWGPILMQAHHEHVVHQKKQDRTGAANIKAKQMLMIWWSFQASPVPLREILHHQATSPLHCPLLHHQLPNLPPAPNVTNHYIFIYFTWAGKKHDVLQLSIALHSLTADVLHMLGFRDTKAYCYRFVCCLHKSRWITSWSISFTLLEWDYSSNN